MSVALAVVTFNRPTAIQRLIRSVRAFYPKVPIYVADQSLEPDPFMLGFYEGHGVTVIPMPFDSGVSRCRNEIVARASEDFIFICDDDCIFTPQTSLTDAASILQACPEVGVVGGRLTNVYDQSVRREEKRKRGSRYREENKADRVFYWEFRIFYDPASRSFVKLPIHMLREEAVRKAGLLANRSDTVLNFALIRRSALNADVRWDPLLKSNGEHDDFYLTWKKYSDLEVVYLPSLFGEHHHPPQVGYQQFRDRTEGWRYFMEKWGVDRHLEFGLGVQTSKDVSRVTEMDELGYDERSLAAMWHERARFIEGVVEHNARAVRESGPAISDPSLSASDGLPADAWLTGQGMTDSEEIALFVAYRREHEIGSDFVLHVRPEAVGAAPGARMVEGLSYSWRKDGHYLVFNAPLNPYKGWPVWSDWTALHVPAPEVSGVLTLELFVGRPNRSGVASAAWGHIVVGERRRFGTADDWVLGWTRPRTGRSFAESSVVESRTELLGLADGMAITLVSPEYTQDGKNPLVEGVTDVTGPAPCGELPPSCPRAPRYLVVNRADF